MGSGNRDTHSRKNVEIVPKSVGMEFRKAKV